MKTNDVLVRLFEARTTIQQTIYDRERLREAVIPSMKHFQEQNFAFLKEYGTEGPPERPNGDPIYSLEPGTPNYVLFMQKMTEVEAVEVELPCHPVKHTSLEGFPMSANEYRLLKPLLDAPPAPPEV